MVSNLVFYSGWLKWSKAVILHFAKEADLTKLGSFLADFLSVFDGLLRLGETVPTKGKIYKLIPALLKWAAANPDPLLPTRERMREMQRQWNRLLVRDVHARREPEPQPEGE